jgi:RimJ/RimL family protein N-acetyltransferase
MFRRQGFGSAAISLLAEYAGTVGYKELWVYTDSANEPARGFYSKLGFELLGPAHEYACGQTIEGSDIVLKLRLAASLDH